MSKFTKMVDVPTVDVLAKIFGNLDENVKLIDKAFEVEVSNRNGSINICGNEGDVLLAEQAIKKLIDLAITGDVIDVLKVNHVCDLAAKGKLGELDSLLTDVVAVTTRGKIIKSKTVGQKKYVDAIKKNTIAICNKL